MGLHEELKSLHGDNLANALMDIMAEHLAPEDLAQDEVTVVDQEVSLLAIRSFADIYPQLAGLLTVADTKLAEDIEGKNEFVDGMMIGFMALKRYVDEYAPPELDKK